ncbi:MAG: SRPBCC family protein [Nocardioidaceae bacterium]
MTVLAELAVRTTIDAPPQRVWDYVTDWERQGEWIPATRVRVQGDGLVARTSIGPFGFTDPMCIRTWQPPRRCEMVHTGRVVHGSGVFECRDDSGVTTFVWTERVDVPGGPLAPALWAVARRPLRAGLEYALRRLRDRIEGNTA